MGDPRISGLGGTSPMPAEPDFSVEGQVLDQLQSPSKNPLEDMKQLFANLSPSDAKELFDHLKDTNPLSIQFSKVFKGATPELLAILESKFRTPQSTSVPAGAVAQQKASPQAAAAMKKEIGMEGSAREAQIRGQLQGESSPILDEAKKIAENAQLTGQEKMAQMGKLLDNASPEDVKQMISDSANWPKGDRDILQAAVQQYSKELRKTDQEAASALVKLVAEDPKMKPQEKIAWMQRALEDTGPKALQQLISDSAKWPDKERDLVDAAMGQSEKVMKRIAKEFSPEAQLDAVNRALTYSEDNYGEDALSKKVDKNVGLWAESTSKEALNYVMDNADIASSAPFAIMDKIKTSSDAYDMVMKLTDKNKAEVMSNIMMDKKISAHDASTLGMIFLNMGPDGKNAAIDKFQDAGDMPKFLESQAKHFGGKFLEGLNHENAEFIRGTFEELGKAAGMKKDVDSAILYQEKELHVKGWIENHFRGK